MMNTVYINGKQQSIPNECATCADLLAYWQDIKQFDLTAPFAIAINGLFIPKASYSAYFLKKGDEIELLTAMQGG